MWGVALLVAGLLAAAAGVVMATTRPRPASLAGALIAPAALCLAYLGAGRVMDPSFSWPASGEALRIMPAGDAITAGSPASGGGYRRFLWRRLAKGRHAVSFVGGEAAGPLAIDRDYAAWHSLFDDDLLRMAAREMARHRPDVVLIHLGRGDLLAGRSPHLVAGRLASLLDSVAERHPRTTILVGTLVGVRGPHAVLSERVAEANAALRRLMSARGADGRVELVEVGERLGRGTDSWASDGRRLSARGDERIAQAWFEALRPHLRRRSP